ncbi:hypothetical protein [Gimesia sp.]|mgnify:CR=1 FL=1|uniref:hypothetical protein n=1 Tax=Gimesia sp. TaxID=2024833 RepID=UPI000C4ED914|nr:hypothetical protein [Gimesia sp.]MAX40973.1 hypothetical protein [Gimesia sp.]HAH46843.1 hypothetical protein [Planctomycetaceae bacterium]HBL42746.1 hypothetical protein [Planctomycetaceae bacterium]|tara:strand:- start:2057 stop:2905 length:849 start_codon:yes stop_codon:yes gene_type:complete
MNEPCQDWKLRDASMTLGDMVRLSWTVSKLKSMEAEQLENVEVVQLAIKEGRDCGNELIERTDELSNEISDARAFREIIEKNTSWVTQTIEDSLHLFANLSDVVVYGIERPSKLIATSGHHAGMMLLLRYLDVDYTSESGFDFEELATHIQSERLRLFQVNDSFDETGVSNGAHQAVIEEIESISERRTLFHDATEELPEEYRLNNGGKPKPLEGNRTELVYAITGISSKPGKFKDMITKRSLWAIKLSDRKYELYFPKHHHSQIEEYRSRLSQYRQKTQAN